MINEFTKLPMFILCFHTVKTQTMGSAPRMSFRTAVIKARFIGGHISSFSTMCGCNLWLVTLCHECRVIEVVARGDYSFCGCGSNSASICLLYPDRYTAAVVYLIL